MTALSYQLYSSRRHAPLGDTLAMLKRLGYDQVEGYGGVYADPDGLAAALADAGLAMPSGHFDLDMLERDPQAVVDIAGTLGMRAVYCPFIAPEQRPADAAGYRAFGERLEKAGEPCRAAGLTFGWHNHDYEFRTLPGGAIPMAEILAGGPSLSWQADLAWIVRGGADPRVWIGRYGARISAAHVKDIAPKGECADEDGWADVGHGTVGWASLWHELKKTACSIFVIEHDLPGDHRRFARRSIESVRRFERSAGG